ncbi:hypothetical protein B0H11DRAFT_1918542 [Mycena galericulata]|nr:hypothetical protein B0H11DRAFT_1918542 [Mycena galericulata]
MSLVPKFRYAYIHLAEILKYEQSNTSRIPGGSELSPDLRSARVPRTDTLRSSACTLSEDRRWLCCVWTSGLGDDSNTVTTKRLKSARGKKVAVLAWAQRPFQHGNDKTTEKYSRKKRLCWPGPSDHSNTVTTKRLKGARGGRRAGRRWLSKAWTTWRFQHGNDKTTESAPSATESRAGQGLGWAIIPTR